MTQKQRALISVFDKTHIVKLARALSRAGFDLISTGGTAKTMRDQGLDVLDVSDITGQPEIFNGRVKTLHPKIHGGILARLDDAEDRAEMHRDGIVPISVVVANLYPFEEKWKAADENSNLTEWIDIGGPTMIRAAAKNSAYVSVVTDPADYDSLIEELDENGKICCESRRALAAKAFHLTASYDAAVAAWVTDQTDQKKSATTGQYQTRLSFSGIKSQDLRYGENPHQSAAAYKFVDPRAPKGLMSATQAQGKELSYNNFNDGDAALRLLREFEDPACVIVKHANPCGVAVAGDITKAYEAAKACDPVSAFGGIIAVNRPLDGPTASAITDLFTEVVIAPAADDAALSFFTAKQNLRLILLESIGAPGHLGTFVKVLSDGFLAQQWDTKSICAGDCHVVSKRAPSEAQLNDSIFAQKIAKHMASNAIVLAKNGQTLGIGAGQMSRIDAFKIALWKAQETGMDLNDAVMASDAFFPFPDVVIAAAAAGIGSVIHPGGSLNDAKVIAEVDRLDLAMVVTGFRHFRH